MMFLNFVYILIIVNCFEIRGLLGIKITFQIIPAVVQRGEHATLRCLYDLQGDSLYAVKWYKGYREIYRFYPSATPQMIVFPILGIYVDRSSSNATQVTLRIVELSAADNYTCEVSGDSPVFSSEVMTSYLDVVVPPESGPVIYADHSNYGPGDVLEANCTASSSRPALNLTVLLNNQELSGVIKVSNNVTGGFQRSIVLISLPLTQSHFRDGIIVLKCIAQMHTVYLDTATLNLPLTSEAITTSSDSSSIIDYLKYVLNLLIINSVPPRRMKKLITFLTIDFENVYNRFSSLDY